MLTVEQRLCNLQVPEGRVDVILDTDTYNEIDDLYALAYLLRSKEKLNTKAIYAAPFHNEKSDGPADGMEKSYREIHRILKLMGESREVFRGSEAFLENEVTPVISSAAKDLAARAREYSPAHPLYVVAIGAITNIASAIILEKKVAENTVVIWLGGHAHHYRDTYEFNMYQDVAAARVVMGSGVPFVQLPCMGVVDAFCISDADTEKWLHGSPIADYLAAETFDHMKRKGHSSPWSKVLWDVTAVAWLLNDHNRFMRSKVIPTLHPKDQYHYEPETYVYPMRYVYNIKREELLRDLFKKLTL